MYDAGFLMYATDFFAVPSSFVKSSGFDAQIRWYASCSTSFDISSGIVMEKSQNRREPYRIACSNKFLPVIDM